MPQTLAPSKKSKVSTPKTYAQLKSRIRRAIREGKSRAQAAVEREKVRTSWEIGKLILSHVLQNRRAEYGAQVIRRLARDLKVSVRELRYSVEFAREYPIRPPAAELPWAQYRDLLGINDTKKRNALIKRADAGDWPRKKLRSELRKLKTGSPTKAFGDDKQGSSDPLRSLRMTVRGERLVEPTPGKIGEYPIIKPKHGPYKGKRVVDLGFSTYVRAREKEGRSKKKEKKKTKGPHPFTYKAWVSKVIDGDTLWAVVDLGFGITTEQKLRLRGIDARELRSAAGQRAKRYLSRAVKKNPFVTITTTKSDKYDRYLIDLWAGDTYLNQALLTAGHASAVSG